jgi:hypothetical protein
MCIVLQVHPAEDPFYKPDTREGEKWPSLEAPKRGNTDGNDILKCKFILRFSFQSLCFVIVFLSLMTCLCLFAGM